MVRRVDENPKLKAKAGPYYYSWAGISGFYRRYLRNAVRMRVECDVGEPIEGSPRSLRTPTRLTYFASKPVRVAEGIAIDDGTLSMAVLKRAAQRDMPGLISRLLTDNRPASGTARSPIRRRPRGDGTRCPRTRTGHYGRFRYR